MILFLINPFFVAMRAAAHDRHELLVKFWVPKGPRRVKELEEHHQFVDDLYDYCGV